MARAFAVSWGTGSLPAAKVDGVSGHADGFPYVSWTWEPPVV
ncbi:MAG: hypothetical protein OXI80_03675 [Caldilineaceae bacterium]|nr:hypothetical protein [Caldilineaceae bacterium]